MLDNRRLTPRFRDRAMKTLRCLSARNHNPSLTDHDSFGPRLYSLEVPLVVEEFWRDEDRRRRPRSRPSRQRALQHFTYSCYLVSKIQQLLRASLPQSGKPLGRRATMSLRHDPPYPVHLGHNDHICRGASGPLCTIAREKREGWEERWVSAAI